MSLGWYIQDTRKVAYIESGRCRSDLETKKAVLKSLEHFFFSTGIVLFCKIIICKFKIRFNVKHLSATYEKK